MQRQRTFILALVGSAILGLGLIGYRLASDLAVTTALPRIPGARAEQTVPAATRSTVNEPLDVSMIQLIARPDDFDGEYVRVVGFYRHEFEGNALYLLHLGMWSGEIEAVTRIVPQRSTGSTEG